MSEPRERILSTIRQALSRNGRLPHPGCPPVVPAPRYRTSLPDDPVERFLLMHQRVHGTFAAVDTLSAVPRAVHDHLAALSAPLKVLISPDSEISCLDWEGLETEFRAARREDQSSVTMAFAGIAETGTLVMHSSAQSPINHHFLPANNVAILKQSRLIDSLENLWPLIGEHPRTINLITGPSKTADIEQTIVYGAHGPRTLHVILVRDDAATPADAD